MATAFQQQNEGRDGSRGGLKHGRCSPMNVHFCEQALVYLIPSANEYTEKERCNIWFQRVEFDQIKANNKILLAMMEHGGYSEDDIYCFRGLEIKTTEGYRRRQRLRSGAAYELFSEQDRQWNTGTHHLDSELIREVYEKCTAECQILAHQIGLQDALLMLRDDENEIVKKAEENEQPAYTEAGKRSIFYRSYPDDSTALAEDSEQGGYFSSSSTKSVKSMDAEAPSHRKSNIPRYIFQPAQIQRVD